MNMFKPTKVIFDTDIGCDCDDAGALALIHRLCDAGEAELLAVTHCFNSPYFAGCIDAINHFYKREVPIGINYNEKIVNNPRGVYAAELCEKCENGYPPEYYNTEKTPKDTLRVLREILASSDDNSVTFIVTGALNSMARLILSKPDKISSLSGKELVEKKIRRTVVMGGRFFESWPMILYESGNPTHHVMTWEYNIRGSGYDNTKTVLDNWKGELVFSSYEIGSYIVTLKGYSKRAKANDPVALAYKIHNNDTGRCSWDLCAVLEAIRPGVYWNYHEFGKISVDEELVTHWNKDENGRHSYVLPKVDYEDIRKAIDDLVDTNC